MITTSQCVRGCGTRDAGGTYLCSGLGTSGQPIEYFVIDPIRLWPADFQRGFKILPTKQGYNNVAIFVGESFYSSCWDFVEETKQFGASRKVSPTFPFGRLTPGKSRMIFIHPSCYIPEDLHGYFETDEKPPLDKHCSFNGAFQDEMFSGWHPKAEKNSFCTFAHKNLAYWFHDKPVTFVKHIEAELEFTVEMADFTYDGIVPNVPKEFCADPKRIKGLLLPGAFLSLPLTHVEFSHVENKKVKLRANKAGYETTVLGY